MALAASTDPGTWALAHPQRLVVLFAGAVWLFNMIARARSAASSAEGRPPGEREPAAGGQGGAPSGDPEDDERARRVRAEILRKIAERRTGLPVLQPARAREERWSPGPPDMPADALMANRGPAEGPSAAGAPAARPLGGAPAPIGAASPGLSAGAAWLEELRGRDSARRAILVREILGPPVALRRG